VPVPSERPYSLGQDSPMAVADRRNPSEMSAAARVMPRGERTGPPVVSAYAATPRAPAAFVSGRGLY